MNCQVNKIYIIFQIITSSRTYSFYVLQLERGVSLDSKRHYLYEVLSKKDHSCSLCLASMKLLQERESETLLEIELSFSIVCVQAAVITLLKLDFSSLAVEIQNNNKNAIKMLSNTALSGM